MQHLSPSFAEAPRLTRRSPHSFACFDLPSFTTWLEANGFTRIPSSRSLVEYGRWCRSGRLVIVYNSGAVVCQGIQPAPCIHLLETLVGEPVERAVLV